MNQASSQKGPVDPQRQQELLAEIQRCWPDAQRHWSHFLLLNDPAVSAEAPSIAQIHMSTRQVLLNDAMILEHDLVDCVEALLAHEVGHHVRYPGTMAVEARMRMLEQSVLVDGYSLTNVFQDLMINQRLGKTLREPLIRIYQAFTSEPAFHQDTPWKRDPAFLFYLALYEALWQLPPGTLIGIPEPEFATAFPGYRAEAQVVVHELFHMEPNIYTQFLYFASVMTRYLKPMIDEDLKQWVACQCGADEPSPQDWAEALTPTEAERQAIDRAIRAGWLEESQAERLKRLNELEERIANLPGFGTQDAALVPQVMAAYYRQLAESHLLKPPPLPRFGEAVVPTTLDEWEVSDSVREIDWLATFLQRGGELGAAQPLKRIPIAELEGFDVQLWQPRLEIYLDVSGSMPNPVFQLNAMTLAAQILTLGTTRAGGTVRAALYSCEPVLYWSWCRSDLEMSHFLMHYIGGGTEFPFELLKRSSAECAGDQPIRIIITDSDFEHNFASHPDNHGIFVSAVEKSKPLILLLHHPSPKNVALYRRLGAVVIEITDFADFPKLATQLAHTLFPDTTPPAMY